MPSKNPRIKGFDELDSSQFTEPESKAAELAGELSRQRSGQDSSDTKKTVDTDDQHNSSFGFIASQLTDVHEDIRKAKRVIREFEERGDVEAAQGARDYLGQLRIDRKNILEDMSDMVAPIKRTGQWRFIDKSPADIKRALVNLPGFREAADQLAKENPDIGQQAGFVLLDELTSLIQEGRLSVPRDFWRRQVLDKPVLIEEEKGSAQSGRDTGDAPERRRYFDPEDYDYVEWQRHQRPDVAGPTKRQLKLRARFSDTTDLPRATQRGYDSQEQQQKDRDMTSSPEQPNNSGDQDPWRHVNSELRDDLKDVLGGRVPSNEQSRAVAENDTEAFYGAPPSPLDSKATDRTPDDETRRILDENDTDAYYGAPSRPENTGASRAEQANSTAESQQADEARLNEVESANTAEFGGQTFNRGDKVLYESDSGHLAEYYVLCNSIGEPPGLVVQSVGNESMVFAIGSDTEASRVRKIRNIEEVPDGSGEPGESEPGEPGGPSGPEGLGSLEDSERHTGYVERVPNIPTAEDILNHAEGARLNVDAQIRAIAEAKEQREKLFGRTKRDQAGLEQANQALESIYAQYMDNWAAVLAGYRGIEEDLNNYKSDMQEKTVVLDASLTSLEADTQLPPSIRQQRIDIYRDRLMQAREAIQLCDERIAHLSRSVEGATQRLEVGMIIEMAQTRTKIETAQTELKAGKITQKFKNWWRSKGGRRTRLVVGAALGITGAAVAMTGVGAGVGGAMVAGAGAVMRGTGGYMATEAGWNMMHDKRADKKDLRARTEAWGSQAADRQAEAERDMRVITENAGVLGAENMTGQELEAFMKANTGVLYSDRMLQSALAGNPEASATAASLLLKTQLDRVQSDAKSNKTAKRAGAVVGVAAAAAPFALKHFFGGPPPESPGPPKPPTDAYNPLEDRYTGIMRTSPGASQNWEQLGQFAEANPVAAAAEQVKGRVLDATYNRVSQGMGLNQLRQLNDIIGVGSVSHGNEAMEQILPAIARQVKDGASTEQILTNFNIPAPSA